jgi:hypothetical protein
MRYVTVPMIIAHTGKHPNTVRNALKAANVPFEKPPGAKGVRIKESDANRFIAKQWPGIKPLPLPCA